MSEARTLTLDFSKAMDIRQHKSGKLRDKLPSDQRPISSEGKLLTPKQIRARARRKMKRAEIMTQEEHDYLGQKPVEEWDLEELSRGRPRASDGTFRGTKPRWITRAVHEQSMDLFKAALKTEMNHTTVSAMEVVQAMIINDDIDDKGRPIVSPSTKLDAAKFLIEHVVGKPKQHLEADVSVKLQGILATVMGNPTESLMAPAQGGQGYTLGHLPGVTIPFGEAEPDERDEEGGDE